jgi:nicotinamide-nucleotide amidase
MEKVFASIITIGDELLIGQVIDTNSAWIAQELNKAGVLVKSRVSVGDTWDDIWNALETESKKATLVFITGGLGPTADDITKPLLCKYFGGKMVMDEATLAHVTLIFEKILKRPMIDRNRKQAEVPDVCTVLKNEKGTAPGMMFEKDGVIFISMPGVPHEMKWIMTTHVIPLIEKRFTTGFIRHRTLLTAGIGESFLAEMIEDIEVSLPPHIKLAYLPNYGMVRLRLSGTGGNANELEEEIAVYFRQLLERTKQYLVIDEDIPMELVVGKLLKERNQTITTAESCTGGYIAHLITKHSGSSRYYKGSIVSYANEIKETLLDVPASVLKNEGAVSEETVRNMAITVRAKMQTHYSVAVSGIMGPDGGSEKKPVGMVWVAVDSAEKTVTKMFQFRFDRSRNIELTAINALNLLRQVILGQV